MPRRGAGGGVRVVRRADEASDPSGEQAPPGPEAAAQRERLLAALPGDAHELLARFEAAMRAEERQRLAVEFAALRAMPSGSGPMGAMGDAALGAALAAEATDGPLAYCGPEEMMRLLVASFDEEDEAEA